MTANERREYSIRNNPTLKKEFTDITNQIYDEMISGNFSAVINFTVSDSIRNHLKAEGYTVITTSHHNKGNKTKIEWI